jgi:hypothetical protein
MCAAGIILAIVAIVAGGGSRVVPGGWPVLGRRVVRVVARVCEAEEGREMDPGASLLT